MTTMQMLKTAGAEITHLVFQLRPGADMSNEAAFIEGGIRLGA